MFLDFAGGKVLAKIAIESSRPITRRLASGPGWTVSDVVCSAGPHDRPFEEQHTAVTIAIVVAGTFQYRSSSGLALMTPGSLLLGNPGQCFSCGHEHGEGDRCISFSYTPEFFERLAADAVRSSAGFKATRIPPLRTLAPLIARGSSLLAGADSTTCEELGIQLAARALQVERGVAPRQLSPEPSSLARVTRVVRMIENETDFPHDVNSLAGIARLSPYHFLRTFEALTGTTPHQYILRLRLRRAAIRLQTEHSSISDIAFDCGFGDISNFNRTFRAEFDMSPRVFRANSHRR
jgi:AraC family transcriptional regulator